MSIYLGIMVNKGNHPQMALIQLSEILSFAQTINHSEIGVTGTNLAKYGDLVATSKWRFPKMELPQ